MKEERSSVIIAPAGGWSDYGQTAELLDYLFGEILKRGWHYMNFTPCTAIFETPVSGGSVYLETDKCAWIGQAILYPPGGHDPEFDALVEELAERFGLKGE